METMGWIAEKSFALRFQVSFFFRKDLKRDVWSNSKTRNSQIFIPGFAPALLVTRIVPVLLWSIRIAAVVGRRRWRWNVLGHGTGTTRHHGEITPTLLQHRHLRVLSHDLQKTFLALFFLLTLSGFQSLATLALALLNLLDLASGKC